MEQGHWKVADIAKLLGISQREVYQLAYENVIPHIRIPRPGKKKEPIRFPKEQVVKWHKQLLRGV